MGRLSAQGISDRLLNEFKDRVRWKYGKLHTVYGIELAKAMRWYLLQDKDWQAQWEQTMPGDRNIGEKGR